MDKPAFVILQIDRTSDDSFWWGALEVVEDKVVKEVSSTLTLMSIPVKSYSLDDHQFVYTRLSIKNKELVLYIPRNIVKTIVESKSAVGKELFYFAGKTSK